MTVSVSGTMGEALAVLEEASLHSYSESAAFSAAVDHLMLADRDEAVMIAALLACWAVTELHPAKCEDLDQWLEEMTSAVKRTWRRA